MNARSGRAIALVLAGVAIVAGAALALQRYETRALEREIGWLREDHAALVRLRTENERLKAGLPAAAEIERLRADRAAVGRLRAEIEGMKARAEPPNGPQAGSRR